jgi:hypothetical protein
LPHSRTRSPRSPKETAVEFPDVLLDCWRITAFIHCPEKIIGSNVKAAGLALVLLDQFQEGTLRQKVDVVREHGAAASLEEATRNPTFAKHATEAVHSLLKTEGTLSD